MIVAGADEIPEGKPKKAGTWGGPYITYIYI